MIVSCLLAVLAGRDVNAQGMPPTNPVLERLRNQSYELDPAENDVARQELAHYLEGLDRVRVQIVVAPGHGHQSANVRLIQRLRELGFRGVVEVIYRENSSRQLLTLIPGFDPWQSHQLLSTPELGRLEMIPFEEFAKDRGRAEVELGFLGANDQPSSIYDYRVLRVKNLLQLQPRNWVRRGSDRIAWIEGPRMFDLGHLYRLGTTITPPDPSNVEALLAPLQNGKAFFRAFFDQAPRLDVMPAYSIDFTEKPEKVMDMVLGGLRAAMTDHPERFTKPIVIPIFTVIRDDKQRASFDAFLRAQDVQVLTATGTTAPKRLYELAPREVLAVHVGATPPPLFEAVVSRATLPVILEGKNLTQMALDHGLPFLNVIGSQRDIDQEMYDRKPGDRVYSLVNGAFNAFDDRLSRFGHVEKKAIGSFIAQTLDPESSLRRFFREQRADPASLNRDLLAQALLELRAAQRYAAKTPAPQGRPGYMGSTESAPRGGKRCQSMHLLAF